jgi:hypothetical protein
MIATLPARLAVQGITSIDIPAAVQRKTDLYVDLAGGASARKAHSSPPLACSCCHAAASQRCVHVRNRPKSRHG